MESFITPEALYDSLGATYQDKYASAPAPLHYLARLHARLAAPSAVLDAGCGTGVPAAQYLSAAGHAVTGVDVSAGMLALARAQVPAATFVQADMRAFAPAAASDAVVACFCLSHLLPGEIDAAVARFRAWVKPRGWLLVGTVLAEDAARGGDPDEAERFRRGEAVVEWLGGHRVRSTALSDADWRRVLARAGWELVETGSSDEVASEGKRGIRMCFYIARNPEMAEM